MRSFTILYFPQKYSDDSGNSNMNYLDILIAIPMVWFAWKGFTKGFIISLAGLVGLALGIYIAIRFAGFTAEKLNGFMNISEEYINLVAFIVTFVAIVALVFLFAHILESALKKVNLSLANKLAGMTFAMLKTALILSSLIYIYNRIDKTESLLKPELKSNSLLYEPIEKVAPALYPYMDIEKWKKGLGLDANSS
jgi:membrane protein required for colicin V production